MTIRENGIIKVCQWFQRKHSPPTVPKLSPFFLTIVQSPSSLSFTRQKTPSPKWGTMLKRLREVSRMNDLLRRKQSIWGINPSSASDGVTTNCKHPKKTQKEFLANYLENASVVFIKGRKELVLPGRDRGGNEGTSSANTLHFYFHPKQNTHEYINIMGASQQCRYSQECRKCVKILSHSGNSG